MLCDYVLLWYVTFDFGFTDTVQLYNIQNHIIINIK
jgi:hypothetical protein